MNGKCRILVVDDEFEWRDAVTELLSSDNIKVDAVGTTDEAQQKLKDNFYHIAILDLQMEAQEDMTNLTGISTLESMYNSGLLNATPVIVLSGMVRQEGSEELIRRVFKYNAVDFFPKTPYDRNGFLKLVQETIKNKLKINLNLKIQFTGITIEKIITKLTINGTRIKRDHPHHSSLCEELEDLLRRLFYTAKSLLLTPLSLGGSGAIVLLATPSYDSGVGNPEVVKIGDHRQIDTEFQNFEKYINHFIGGGRSTNVLGVRRSLRLAGIVYSLLGRKGNKIENFRSFFSHAEKDEVVYILRQLFFDICGQWYANKGPMELVNIIEEYENRLDCSPEGINRAIRESMKNVHGNDLLYFDGISEKRAFPSPIKFLSEYQLSVPTYLCATHGDMNPDNIIIDQLKQVWLIDFGETGKGHILRDVAELDTAIRYQLLNDEQATLEERLQMEEALNIAQNFSDIPDLENGFYTENKALEKLYKIIVELRKIGFELIMQNPNAEIKEYYTALLFYSLNSVKFYSWTSLQRHHALLSACLLVKTLKN